MTLTLDYFDLNYHYLGQYWMTLTLDDLDFGWIWMTLIFSDHNLGWCWMTLNGLGQPQPWMSLTFEDLELG